MIKYFESPYLDAPYVKHVTYLKTDESFMVLFSNKLTMKFREEDFESSWNMKYFLDRCRLFPNHKFSLCVQNTWNPHNAFLKVHYSWPEFYCMKALKLIVSDDEIGKGVEEILKLFGGYIGLNLFHHLLQNQPNCKIQFERFNIIDVMAKIIDPNTRFIFSSRSHCFVVLNGWVYSPDPKFPEPRFWHQRHEIGVGKTIDYLYQIVPKVIHSNMTRTSNVNRKRKA